MSTVLARLKEGDLILVDEVDERTPVITSGLTAHFPFDDTEKGVANNNILDYSTWVVGSTGSQTGFSQNGDGNSIVEGDGPFGYTMTLWQTLGNDVASDADGGWNTSSFTVDNTKLYRFSTWVNRKVIGNGSFYLGCHGYGSVAGVYNNANGTSNNTNPYFWSGGIPSNLEDTWMLVVGHVFPYDHTDTSMHPDSGRYTIDGTKVGSTSTDYRWRPETTTGNHRSYLYYSTDPTTQQLWAYPRVDICDGTEPSLQDLLQGLNHALDPSVNTNNTLTPNGLAVEEATTNLVTNPVFYGLSTITSPFTAYGSVTYSMANNIFIDNTQSLRMVVTGTANDGSQMNRGVRLEIPVTSGVTYTFSFYGKGWEDKSSISFYSTQYTSQSVSKIVLNNMWTRYIFTGTASVTATATIYIRPNNNTLYDFDCLLNAPQFEQKSFATSFVNGSRTEGDFKLTNVLNPSKGTVVVDATFHEDNTVNGVSGTDQYCFGNQIVSNAANDFWFHDTDWWWIRDSSNVQHSKFMVPEMVREERTHIALVYDDTDGTMDIYKNGVLASDGVKVATMIGLLGSLGTNWTHAGHATGTTNKMSQTIHSLSFYNRPLTSSEVNKLANSSFSIDSSGVLKSSVIERSNNIPDDDMYFPLGCDSLDSYHMISPVTESNTVYENGSVWVGEPTTNLYDGAADLLSFAVVDANNTLSSLDYDMRFNGDGEIVKVTKIAGTPAAHASYRRCLTVTFSVPHTVSFKIKMLSGGTVQDRIRVHFDGATGGALTYYNIGDGWYKCSYTATSPSSGSLCVGVGFIGDGALECLITEPQLEQQTFDSPFVDGTRAISTLNYPVDTIDLTQDFTICGWWYPRTGPDAGYDPALTFNRFSSNVTNKRILIMQSSTTSTTLQCWIGNGTNEVTIPVSGTAIQLDTWNFFALRKSGSEGKLFHGVGGQIGTGTNATAGDRFPLLSSSVAGDPTWGWMVGKYNTTTDTVNAYFRDLAFIQSAMTDADIASMYNTQMRSRNDGTLQIQGKIIEGQVL